MPTAAFSVGRDCTLDIIDPRYGALRFAIKTSFKPEAQWNSLSSKGMDGINRYAELPDGWKVSFELDRADGRVDDYFARAEADYFNGVVAPNVSITQTVQERDGSLSIYRFIDVAMRLDGGGEWKGDAKVSQSITGMASRRLKV